MVGETSNRGVWIGLVVSVLLHLGTAWFVLGERAPRAEAAFHRPETAPEQEKKIDLGDPESTAISMSWLGFDEYRKHVAAESLVDQPELTMDPAAPTSAPNAAVAVEQARRVARAAQTEATRVVKEVAGGLRALESLGALIPAGKGARPGFESDQFAERTSREDTVAEASTNEPPTSAPDGSGEAEEADGAPAEAADAEVSPSRATEGSQGRQDDRESDATSVKQASVHDLGNPLSARGLRIRTVKPSFSHYASIMSSPHDPVLRIHFGADGRVKRVELLQSSGFKEIDRPVLDAAYRWTAEGKVLERLGGSETISIEMRILL